MFVAIRLRGTRGIKQGIADAMTMLNLHRKFFCSLVKNDQSSKGMLVKVKDYVTWGEASEESIRILLETKAEKDPRDNKKIKKFFRLHPPKGGFRARGIKAPYGQKGDLGYRGEKINDLLKRMSL
ncbi:uL30 family ribosomal protein [Candidatus Woesearchaeota archaeon]|nr:uL30 family ribosomal protein [Candidatus Woesearchaeota archaeon]